MRQWTDDQYKAINSRSSNLLVSAAAGSGKTAVLIERIINIVLEQRIDIDRLLVVTFTRAAAAEMRQRAADALLKKLSSFEIDEGFIRRQLDKLNQAYMMTFHSFCRDIIQKHYYLINIEASFKTADQATILLLQQEAMDELLEKAYGESNPSFLKLVEMYCNNRDDGVLQEMLLDLYAFSRSHPNPKEWMEQQAQKFSSGEALLASDWISSLKHYSLLLIENIVDTYQRALDMIKRPGGPDQYQATLSKELDQCISLKNNIHDINRMLALLHALDFQRLPACKDTDIHLKETVKGLRDQAKKDIKQLKDIWFFNSIEAYQKDHTQLSDSINQMVDLINEFETIYQEKKKNRNVLDFHDLEHFALRILSFTEAREFYQQQFYGIFIDEYQDSNRVQEALIEKIKQEDNLFMVGDVKQSIYRFRLAEPELFMAKHRTFSDRDGAKNQRIDLTKNFRSHPAILRAVNNVFSQIMSETLGEITYDETAELKAGLRSEAPMEDSPVKVHLVETINNDDNSPGHELDIMTDDASLLEDWTNQELEAKMLLHQVKELLKMKIRDPETDQMRNICYRDIAILLRAPSNQAPQFIDVFSREHIPLYADLGTGFYESLEINMVLDVLRIIDNLHNDIPLLGVLRSPFGGFSTQELTDIRLVVKNTSYAEAFLKAGEESDELGEKIQQFIKKLTSWRRTMRTMPLPDFLWWMMSESNFYALCAAMPGGQQRQANLRIFINKSIEFRDNNDGGLYQFIDYVDRIKYNRKSDYGPAKTLSENDDVIRLMSIHKSKGLEFPVVIIAGLGKQFNRRDLQNSLLMHRTLGFGPLYVDPDLRIRRQTLSRVAIREKLRLETLSEEMRILYVAMTRAQQKLILSGTVKNMNGQIEKWSCSNTEGERLKATSALDWLGPVWLNQNHGKLFSADVTTEQHIQNEKPDHGLWEIHFWDRSSIIALTKEDTTTVDVAAQLTTDAGASGDQELYDQFNDRFTWNYPYANDTVTQSKISVSELARQLKEGNNVTRGSYLKSISPTPLFLTSKKSLSPTEKGTLLHYVMQNIDLTCINSLTAIKKQLNTMIDQEMISQTEANEINTDQIYNFFHHDIGKRYCIAEKKYRELPFVMKSPDDRSVLVQGIIDCCFVEDGEWVLVDYKTDRINEEKLAEWSQSYTTQMNLYKKALESTTNMLVKEAFLYSFHLGREYKII